MSLKLRLMWTGAKLYWRVFRPLTLGVKVLLVQDGQVLLVRHSYQDGWFLPGGGVQRGETVETAVHREAREELGATMINVRLMGVFSNVREYKNDHVIVFVCEAFTIAGADSEEIAEVRFFPLRQLPPSISEGTRRRVADYVTGRSETAVGIW